MPKDNTPVNKGHKVPAKAVRAGDKKPAKKSQGGKAKPKKAFWGKRLLRYFKDVISEVKKIAWPSKKEYLTYTLVVFVFVSIMTAIIFTMNTVLTAGLDLLLRIGA